MKNKQISLVVALAEDGTIGHDNQLLWHLPNDLKYFKALTTDHPIIMGRKTFVSIGRALANRQNIVLTQDKSLTLPGCWMAHSVEEALAIADLDQANEIMVVGGAEIYRLFLPHVTRLYITFVHANIVGEAKLTLDFSQWSEIHRERHASDAKHAYDYSFVIFEGAALTSI